MSDEGSLGSTQGEAALTPVRIWQNFKIPITLGSVSLLLIVLSITLLIKSYQSSAPIQFSSDQSEATIAGVFASLTVDIEGAVVNPGVYQLPTGSRVEEAITAAGGFSSDADEEAIARQLNRAAKLSDGAKLYIPQKGSGLKEDQGQTPLGVLGHEVSAQVSVNAASQAQLEALAGIGPVTAKKIIDGRPYMTLEELVTRKAMSQTLFNKLKEQLTL